MTIIKLQVLFALLVAMAFASKSGYKNGGPLLRADSDDTAEDEISDYQKAGNNFMAFNYGFKGNQLISSNFSKCGLNYLQWKYLEKPSWQVKTHYAETRKERIFNTTKFMQNTSEVLDWCTRVTHDVDVKYTYKFKLFGGKGGYSMALLQNLLGNAIRLETLNEKIADNETTEIYKYFYQGRMYNIILNFTIQNDDLHEDLDRTAGNKYTRLMSVKPLEFLAKQLYANDDEKASISDHKQNLMKYLLQEEESDGDDEDIYVVFTIEEVVDTSVDVVDEEVDVVADEAEAVADDLDDKAEEIKPKLALGLPTQSLLWNLQGLVAYWKGINIGSQIMEGDQTALLICDNVLTLGYFDQWKYARNFKINQYVWAYLYASYAMMYNSYDLSIQCIAYGEQFIVNSIVVYEEDMRDKRRMILNAAYNYKDLVLNKNRIVSFWQQVPITQPDGSITTYGRDLSDYYNAGWAQGRILYHFFIEQSNEDQTDPVKGLYD